ncbi:MAG: hypothetical protein IIW48_09340 [Clostridia bacterium]|nr:hypothetical protein [Clostridia bacterium]
MHDDSDVKIFKANRGDNDNSELYAVAEELKFHVLNGNSAKAKQLGKELASLSPESENLINELTETLEADWIMPEIRNQLRLLMVFSAEYTLLSELCPMLATSASEAFYNEMRNSAPDFYNGISNGAAMSFYYMAVKQYDTAKAVGESFAMLCNAKTDERILDLGSKVFLLTCKHIVKIIDGYTFEK